MDQLFDYVAWLRDPEFPPGHQEHEWPAVFIVVAEDAEAAKSWGDHHTLAYALRSGQLLISSSVEALARDPGERDRVVRVGDGADDPFE